MSDGYAASLLSADSISRLRARWLSPIHMDPRNRLSNGRGTLLPPRQASRPLLEALRDGVKLSRNSEQRFANCGSDHIPRDWEPELDARDRGTARQRGLTRVFVGILAGDKLCRSLAFKPRGAVATVGSPAAPHCLFLRVPGHQHLPLPRVQPGSDFSGESGSRRVGRVV